MEGLSVSYGDQLAVRNFSVDVNSDEVVVLFGPSGCGKTSILLAILGVRQRKIRLQGSIKLNGSPIRSGEGRVGMVFQGPVLPDWLKVREQCRLSRAFRKEDNATADVRILEILESFGIRHLADVYPSRMSGGERQRAALAVALVNKPEALLLDEPTTFLDGVSREVIWTYLESKVAKLMIPRVYVSHDPEEAILLADRILVLGDLAEVVCSLPVEFEHPRSLGLTRGEKFWELRKALMEAVATVDQSIGPQ